MSVNHHCSFELVKALEIPSVNIQYQEFKHIKTGAQHIHLASDSQENAFLLALRTVPQDSTGVAHILEHTALCGSEKFPVKDPFMSMASRSLKTFMNAFTSSDWTAYPFASQNNKDFNNLLRVYLDAVFFPRLEPLAFAQEGHRVEFSESDNPESDLIYNGVVYNEMKGALSSIKTLMAQEINHHLYLGSTYHYNSGGDPKNIPELTYEQFVDFHKNHYHPSNAIFLTFGNIPASEHQAIFEQNALHSFERSYSEIKVNSVERYTQPKKRHAYYALDAEQNTQNQTYLTMSWLLGDVTDLSSKINAILMSELLLGNSASPLLNLLESTTLGSSVSPVLGVNLQAKEMSFTCGISGAKPEDAEQFEQLVMSQLQKISEQGLPISTVEAALHQLELSQREVVSRGVPYGIGLLMKVLGNATHYGDAELALNLDSVLSDLQEQVRNPDYIKSLVKSLLIDNTHRMSLVMEPSTTLAKENKQAEFDKLAVLKQNLSSQQKQDIVEQSKQLLHRQKLVEDKSVLPKISREDIPSSSFEVKPEIIDESQKITAYSAGTNGFVYQSIAFACPDLKNDELSLLPIYAYLIKNIGIEGQDYLQTEKLKNSILGNFDVQANFSGDKSSSNKVHGNIVFSVNGLSRNKTKITEFLRAAVSDVSFDEKARIRELLSQLKMRSEMNITQAGHVLAMTSAASALSVNGYVTQNTSGLGQINFLKKIEQQIASEQGFMALQQSLNTIHSKVINQPHQRLLVCEQEQLKETKKLFNQAITCLKPYQNNLVNLSPTLACKNVAWVANTQVNFCAKAFPTVSSEHFDAAKLSVLAGVIQANFLHQAIRESGGAYGGGAFHDAQTATFKLFSYRDPRLQKTLDDFDAAINWAQTANFTQDMIEESVLSLIAQLDAPKTPANEAKSNFENNINGLTHSDIETFRQRVLAVTAEDLRAVANAYFSVDKGTTAVITNKEQASQLNFETIDV